ncbi:hypothetical protein DFH08DRAFT_867167, partial [Mycena albidolilacea]
VNISRPLRCDADTKTWLLLPWLSSSSHALVSKPTQSRSEEQRFVCMPSIFKPVDLPWTSLGQFYTAKVHTASRASPTRFLPHYPPTTCTPYRHVPQGIIDLHPTSLLACTFVCWAFVPTCRAARLRSPTSPCSPAPVRLHSPHLAMHVRDLTVRRLLAPDSPLPALPGMLSNLKGFGLFG